MSALLLLLLAAQDPVTYHVDADAGDDAGPGTAPAAAWKTVARVNAARLKPGDRVLFRRGRTFRGPLAVPASGEDGRPITFAAYGDGPRPELTGFAAPADWTPAGPGAWDAPLPGAPAALHAVSLDGRLRPLGRTPNADAPGGGWLTVDAHAGKASITDAGLPEGDWTGAELVLRKYRWVIDRSRVTRQAGTTLEAASPSAYEPVDGHGYFLQNHPRTLDVPGEWWFDPAARTLRVFTGGAAPARGAVRASVVDVLVSLKGRHDVILEGLRLSGANRVAVDVDDAARILLRDVAIAASGVDAVRGGRVDGVVLEDVRIEDTHNDAVRLDDGASRCALRRAVVERTGMHPGMGASGDGTYNAVMLLGGADNRIEECTVTDTGYLPVQFGGSRVVVRDNLIRGFASVKDDAGGIYTWTGANPKTPTPDRTVTGNIILDGHGAPHGALGATKAFGIYLDDVASDVEVRGNTVARTDAGLFLHNAFRCRIEGNAFVDNRVQLLITHDGIPGAEIRDIAFAGNALIARTPAQGLLWATSMTDDFAKFGAFERTLYARPAGPGLGFRLGLRDGRPRAVDLDGWRALTGLDLSSRQALPDLPRGSVRTVGPNLVRNGDFAKDASDASCWSGPGNAELLRAEGPLDGGCLHHRYRKPSGAPQTSLVMMNAGGLRAGRRYLLRFTVQGTAKHGSAGVRLREGEKPWGPLTEPQDAPMDAKRRDVELLFTAPRDQAASAIEWSFNEDDGTFWLDNVRLHEAEVVEPDPAAFRLEINPTAQAKTVALEGAWTEVEGAPAGPTLSLPPRGARVLLRR